MSWGTMFMGHVVFKAFRLWAYRLWACPLGACCLTNLLSLPWQWPPLGGVLMLLHGRSVIKLVCDGFITTLLGNQRKLFRNSIVEEFLGWTVKSLICCCPFHLPLGVVANTAYHNLSSIFLQVINFAFPWIFLVSDLLRCTTWINLFVS